jgi:predicted phage tail component-like protein
MHYSRKRTVTYNGVNLSNLFSISDVSRPLPNFKSTATAIAGRDGEVFDSLSIGTRECSFSVTALDKSPEGLQNAARQLSKALFTREPAKLVFSDELDGKTQLYRLAVPNGAFNADEFIRDGKWDCRFLQHDPFLHGKNIAVQFSGTATISVGGNVETYPVATANASGTYQISYKGQHVRFDGAGGRIIVDFRKQKVSSGGATGDGLQVGSRFFALQPGQAKISATHSTQLEYTELWL